MSLLEKLKRFSKEEVKDVKEAKKEGVLIKKEELNSLVTLLSSMSQALVIIQETTARNHHRLESIEASTMSSWILLTGIHFKDMDDEDIEDFVEEIESTRVKFNDVLLRLKGYQWHKWIQK